MRERPLPVCRLNVETTGAQQGKWGLTGKRPDSDWSGREATAVERTLGREAGATVE